MSIAIDLFRFLEVLVAIDPRYYGFLILSIYEFETIKKNVSSQQKIPQSKWMIQ